MSYSLRGKRVAVLGASGMVGRALVRRLGTENCTLLTPRSSELDLRKGRRTQKWFKAQAPDAVFMAAATVGGIHANSVRPFDFLFDNVTMAASVMHAAHKEGVKKLVYLGSSCIYPKMADQPIPEGSLLTGELEPTNAPYAIAKIAGLKMGEALRAQHGHDFVSAMPTNLYGPWDNFHPTDSHVIPGMIQRAHARKMRGERDFPIWGTGTPRREFLHVDDCADALVRVMETYSESAPINIGTGEDIAIRDLARLVMEVVGLKGEVIPDPTQPDGTPRKLLDVGKLARLDWTPKIGLREGLEQTYAWYVSNSANARR